MASTAHKLNPETSTTVRAPHLALADQVTRQGSTAARALYDAARLFNASHFEAKLLPCFIEITPPGSTRSLADYRPRSAEGVESHIRISTRVVNGGGKYALDVLLHEMVHAYCWEVLGDIEPGYGHHGPKWTAQCNRIGRTLGLPEVFTKGRGGPNSARWPMCVRPEGYYQPKGEPGESGDEGEGEGEGGEPKKRTKTVKAPPLDQIVALLKELSRGELDTLQAVVDAMCEERDANEAEG